jgi:hypothetical protein
MKLFALLMSVYMLLLSAMPCNDAADCERKSMVKIEQSGQGDDHEEHEENCTPFCICTCCASSAIHNPVLIKHQVFSPEKIFNEFFTAQAFTINPDAIWQPPRAC